MTDFKAWIPPAGAVVDPPVHPETVVEVIYSDGTFSGDEIPARRINWSSFGDGPSVVAYAIVEEYKPAPKVARERYLCVRDNGSETMLLRHEVDEYGWKIGDNAFLMREVLEGREVVAWAVVDDMYDCTTPFGNEFNAIAYRQLNGGTVVRLSGVLPNG